MKKIVIFLLAIVGVQCAVNAQRKQSFDEGWRFHRGEVMNAEAVDCDDSQWREVIVPHDFSMEPVAYTHDYREQTTEWKDWQVGPFSRLSIGDWDSGQTVGGTGWYRKTFTLPTNSGSLDNTLRNKSLRLRFDGVYNQAEVWVNGWKAAMNVYGYMPFVVDLNAILKDNANRDPKDERRVTIAVKAVNEGLNCRWYSGSGIYRHVWLETTDRLHLDEWDTYVDASVVNGKNAIVKVSAKVFDENVATAEGTLKVQILDAEKRENDYWDRTAQKMSWDKDSPRAFDLVEVGGYNYEQRRYESDHERFPERIMYGSETYPNAIAGNWQLVEKHPYAIGDFVWTAIDYIGEAGLGHALERSDRGRWIQLLAWPWFNAWCGDIDLVGNKKPQSYYRDVVWGERPIAMAVRPSVTDGEYEDALGWCWTAEENHWNWYEQAYYDGPNKCGYLPVDIRPDILRETGLY